MRHTSRCLLSSSGRHLAPHLPPSLGSANARYSPGYGPPLTATTIYCRPLSRYVMGDPLCGAGIHTAPTSFPDALSYARNIAPRGCSVVVVTCPSPAITSDFVTSVPML